MASSYAALYEKDLNEQARLTTHSHIHTHTHIPQPVSTAVESPAHTSPAMARDISILPPGTVLVLDIRVSATRTARLAVGRVVLEAHLAMASERERARRSEGKQGSEANCGTGAVAKLAQEFVEKHELNTCYGLVLENLIEFNLSRLGTHES
jgi:hypothetical protein